MDLEDVFTGLVILIVVGVIVALMAFTAAWLVSVGVWPIVAWGWFGVLVIGGAIAAVAENL